MARKIASVAIFIIGILIFIYGIFNYSKSNNFVAPVAELNAVQGEPVVSDELGWSELYRDGMAYRFYICGICAPEYRQLPIWFWNEPCNEALLQIRVYSANGKILGESGFIKPGEYIPSVEISRDLQSGEEIKYEIIGYSPDTYYSLGNVTLNTVVS